MTLDSQPRFLDTLREAARENPLAATLIGGGALWMLFGKGASSAYSEAVRPAAELGLRSVAEAASDVASSAQKEAEELGEEARSAASKAASGVAHGTAAIKDVATETLQGVGQRLREAPDVLPDMSGRVREARSALSGLLEQQPLILGAVGIAIGAAFASAAAVTRLEEKWAGETSSSLKDAVAARAGVTLNAAEDAVRAIGGEVKASAAKVVDSLRQAGDEEKSKGL